MLLTGSVSPISSSSGRTGVFPLLDHSTVKSTRQFPPVCPWQAAGLCFCPLDWTFSHKHPLKASFDINNQKLKPPSNIASHWFAFLDYRYVSSLSLWDPCPPATHQQPLNNSDPLGSMFPRNITTLATIIRCPAQKSQLSPFLACRSSCANTQNEEIIERLIRRGVSWVHCQQQKQLPSLSRSPLFKRNT